MAIVVQSGNCTLLASRMHEKTLVKGLSRKNTNIFFSLQKHGINLILGMTWNQSSAWNRISETSVLNMSLKCHWIPGDPDSILSIDLFKIFIELCHIFPQSPSPGYEWTLFMSCNRRIVSQCYSNACLSVVCLCVEKDAQVKYFMT